MQAIRCHAYGPPDRLELREVDVPVLDDDGVLVRVRAASVNPYDWHLMRGLPYFVRLMSGLRRPKSSALGADVAGVVEAVGANVTTFRPGDEVFGARSGAFAEYVGAVGTSILVPKPPGLTFEQVASIPIAGTTALQALRDKGRLAPGQSVLVNGAAGGVGTFAVQIAKALGAEVTGVCSTRNLDLVRSIGADVVVDYTVEDFTRQGERYDLILDAVGNRSLADLRRALAPKGTLVIVGGSGGRWLAGLDRSLRALAVSPFVGQTMSMVMTKHSKDDLLALAQLTETGKLTPVIDRTYPLAETAEAIRYLEAGHAQGKVVITA